MGSQQYETAGLGNVDQIDLSQVPTPGQRSNDGEVMEHKRF